MMRWLRGAAIGFGGVMLLVALYGGLTALFGLIFYMDLGWGKASLPGKLLTALISGILGVWLVRWGARIKAPEGRDPLAIQVAVALGVIACLLAWLDLW